MKKILFILFLCLFITPIVNAEVYDPCFDDYKIADGITFSSTNNYHARVLVNLPLSYDDTKTYYLKFWNLDSSHSYQVGSSHYFYDSDGNILAKNTKTHVTVSKISDNGLITYSSKNTLENVSYFHLSFYTYSANGYHLPNTDVILTLSDHELTTCPVIEEPDVPESPGDEPEKPTIIPDTTLDDFYSIYLNKLVSLSNFSTENKFVLSAIGIFILFIVLELVLNLFNKGGYR